MATVEWRRSARGMGSRSTRSLMASADQPAGARGRTSAGCTIVVWSILSSGPEAPLNQRPVAALPAVRGRVIVQDLSLVLVTCSFSRATWVHAAVGVNKVCDGPGAGFRPRGSAAAIDNHEPDGPSVLRPGRIPRESGGLRPSAVRVSIGYRMRPNQTPTGRARTGPMPLPLKAPCSPRTARRRGQ